MLRADSFYSFESVNYCPFICPDPSPPSEASRVELSMKNNNVRSRKLFIRDLDADYPPYVIDNCIRVNIPSDESREAKVKHWQEKHWAAKQWAWIDGSAAVLAALGSVGAIAKRVNPFIAVILGLCSVAGMVFCGLNIRRTSEPSRQIKGWQANPIKKLENERTKAYEQGFPYVYTNRLKLSLDSTSDYQILLPFEVEFLFEKYFEKFCTTLLYPKHPPSSDQEKKEWLDRFTNCNPIADEVLRYAHTGVVPEKYAQMSSVYEFLHEQLTNLHEGEASPYTNFFNDARNLLESAYKLKHQYSENPFENM